jgi:hypothetical protein
MVSVVQEMVGRKYVDLSHTYHPVAMKNLKACCQYPIPDFRHWSTHEGKYLVGCQCKQVKPNKCVMSAITAMTNTGEGIKEQGTLEGWNTANTKVPLWSKEGLMEHIIKLVVVDDQVRQMKFIYVTYLKSDLSRSRGILVYTTCVKVILCVQG